MNKTKKRLLSCLLLAMGGLNSGTGVSNASPRISIEKSEKNSKVSSIFNVRNFIDLLGLSIIFYGGKRLRYKDDKIAKDAEIIKTIGKEKRIAEGKISSLNSLIKEANKKCKEIGDSVTLLRDFDWLFYVCAPFCKFSKDYGWRDLKEEEYGNYKFVCHDKIYEVNSSSVNAGTFWGRSFVTKVKLEKNEVINKDILEDLKINKDNLKSVTCFYNFDPIYCVSADSINAAGIATSYLFKIKPQCVRIIEFEKIFSNKSFIDNLKVSVINKFNPGDPLCLEELKEKFKNCYIVCEVYEDPETKGTYYLGFSLVKPKVSVKN